MLKNNIIKVNTPNHVAIIMDGNRRWASRRGLPSVVGHQYGIKSLKEIIKASFEFKIKELTVFAFSTENWSRGAKEINSLQELFERTLKSEIAEINSNNIKLEFIGDLN